MVSIIIPNYNKFDLLNNCIINILNGEYGDIEIIVVDNGSLHEEKDIIYHEKVKYVWLLENKGFSFAVNEGIKQSEAEYIAILNNDTEPSASWIKNAIIAFEQNKEVIFVTSKIKSFLNKEFFDDVGDIILPSGRVYKIGNNEKDTGQYDRERYAFGASGCASIYRREFFDKVGYFDEDFFAYLEDIDLSFRATLLGYKCLYVPDAVVYHVGSATTGSQYNDFTVFHLAQNTMNVIIKNFPGKLISKYIFSILIYIAALQIFFMFNGLGVAYFKGLISGVRMTKKMLPKRKKIQETRILANREVTDLFNENRKLYKLSKNRSNL